jgi:hypothetical protein
MNVAHESAYLLLAGLGLAAGLLGAFVGARLMARSIAASAEARRRIAPSFGDAETLRVVEAAVAAAMKGVEATLLQRVPQWVQQAVRVELEFQTRQLDERDEVRAQEQQRRQAAQEEQRAAELRAQFQVLSAQVAAVMVHAADEAGAGTVVAPSPPRFVRLAAQGAVEADTDAMAELSDEEIDALPPDLPGTLRPRKRILPAPRKPTMRDV